MKVYIAGPMLLDIAKNTSGSDVTDHPIRYAVFYGQLAAKPVIVMLQGAFNFSYLLMPQFARLASIANFVYDRACSIGISLRQPRQASLQQNLGLESAQTPI